jgi:regulator of cell morphogenesis and NO signaling
MKTIDVRELVCAQRHALIFDTFDALAVGESFEFVNDHRPTPLYRQLCQRYPDQFSWEYLEVGPEVWRMVIHRVANGTASYFKADLSLQIQTNSGENHMTIVDVREIVPRDRHPLIFQTFDSLPAGEHFELINDHDPKPLYYQFLHERPDQFTWEYLEQGPTVWRVAIGRPMAVENN